MTEIAAIGTAPAPSRGTAPASPPLGQADFLRLLTAQLQNQDPLKPLDNAEFLSQLAQFSTVSGIDQVNASLATLGSGLRDTRLAMASDLIGRSVLVPGSVTRAGPDGAVRGAVDLAAAADSVIVTYADAATGAILHSQTLGRQPSGRLDFAWDVPSDLAATRGRIEVGVSAQRNGTSTDLQPLVFNRVIGAETGAAGHDVTLRVEDFGALSSLEIEAFR